MADRGTQPCPCVALDGFANRARAMRDAHVAAVESALRDWELGAGIDTTTQESCVSVIALDRGKSTACREQHGADDGAEVKHSHSIVTGTGRGDA